MNYLTEENSNILKEFLRVDLTIKTLENKELYELASILKNKRKDLKKLMFQNHLRLEYKGVQNNALEVHYFGKEGTGISFYNTAVLKHQIQKEVNKLKRKS